MKRLATWVGTALLASGLWSASGRITQAVQLADGTVYFVQPPSLENAWTTQNSVYAWGATYYFTIAIPANAGEPLQKVTISQQEGPDTVRFDLKDSEAVASENHQHETKVTLGDVTVDRKTHTVTVLFNPPVPAGKTVTLGLRPVRNPDVSGVYLFGVTAYPAGETTHGQFLGYGRLQFYNNRGPLFFFRHD